MPGQVKTTGVHAIREVRKSPSRPSRARILKKGRSGAARARAHSNDRSTTACKLYSREISTGTAIRLGKFCDSGFWIRISI
jgi:hypothetical protein